MLTSTDVPDDMTDRQWLSAAVDESSRTLPGSYVVDVTPWSMDVDTAIVATLVSIVDGRSRACLLVCVSVWWLKGLMHDE